MISKAATRQWIINIGKDLIVINVVKGIDSLFLVMINRVFVGYIEKKDTGFARLDETKIHDLIFARICEVLKQ